MNKIGFNIRKNREIKGFSQDYMANVLNISQASYARLENEDTKITVERLYKIALLSDKKKPSKRLR
jgi:transcriptional regulator with XRE-family HTH domain